MDPGYNIGTQRHWKNTRHEPSIGPPLFTWQFDLEQISGHLASPIGSFCLAGFCPQRVLPHREIDVLRWEIGEHATFSTCDIRSAELAYEIGQRLSVSTQRWQAQAENILRRVEPGCGYPEQRGGGDIEWPVARLAPQILDASLLLDGG
jgi:hypothetical protein